VFQSGNFFEPNRVKVREIDMIVMSDPDLKAIKVAMSPQIFVID